MFGGTQSGSLVGVSNGLTERRRRAVPDKNVLLARQYPNPANTLPPATSHAAELLSCTLCAMIFPAVGHQQCYQSRLLVSFGA